jgi:ADP-ribosylation factor-like protein 2
VRISRLFFKPKAHRVSGLDNAGKTTIVKKIMNEDVNSVSPTLGFIIKTIEYDGYVQWPSLRNETNGKDTN